MATKGNSGEIVTYLCGKQANYISSSKQTRHNTIRIETSKRNEALFRLENSLNPVKEIGPPTMEEREENRKPSFRPLTFQNWGD
jgi:hypothetical protein